MYKPPFNITNEMLKRSMSISEKLGKISNFNSLKRLPILRRNNKIKSIHSSLVIESNSLSLNAVRDVITGKNVIGDKREIQEVKNAYEAYNKIEEFDPYSENDLIKAHGILTYFIDKDNLKYRNHAEGVFDGDNVIFLAPPCDLVPSLMKDLFDWLKNDTETHILIKSCIFHYEFVYIHPFSDGNGRTARLWQNVILTSYNKIFEYLPIESYILKYQDEYYKAIDESNNIGDSNIFITFLLKMIDETLDDTILSLSKESMNISSAVNRLLEVMDYDVELSALEIMKRLNIKSKETLRSNYLNPAIENGLIKMILPDKPNSKNQKYIKI